MRKVVAVLLMCLLCTISYLLLFRGSPKPPRLLQKIIPLNSEIYCFRIPNDSLQDILDRKVSLDTSIFFHETSCTSHRAGKIVLGPRQACSVEAALLWNPKKEVHLTFSSPGTILKGGNETSDRLIETLTSHYENLRISRLDYGRYARGTPVEQVYEGGELEKSEYAVSHSSDLLRFLTLWRYVPSK